MGEKALQIGEIRNLEAAQQSRSGSWFCDAFPDLKKGENRKQRWGVGL